MKSSLISLVGLATAAIAETIDIKVGDGALTFSPDSVTAKEGDTVRFKFYGSFGSHSVVHSSFDTPCQPAAGGYYSGLILGDDSGDSTFSINITSTSPSWFYCSVGRHCQSGMVGVINPPSGQTITAFAAAAKGVTSESAPGAVQGGVVATGGSGGGGGDDSTTSKSASAAQSSASPTPSASASSEATQSSASAQSTTGASSAAASTSASSAASGSASATPAGTTTRASGTAASSSPSVAATATSGGKKSEWSVVLGLTVVVGGLVGLMA